MGVFCQPARVKHLKFCSLQLKMEEFRKVVNILQDKINKLVVSEDAIKHVVNSNIKNIENLNKKIDYVADKLVKSVDRTTDKISVDIHEQEEQQKKLNILMEENNKRMKEVE